MSVVSEQGIKALVREKEPAKEISPRNESFLVKIIEERLHIKGRLHINYSGNCSEELFSYFLRKKEEGREPLRKKETVHGFSN